MLTYGKPVIVADPGSCHCARRDYAIELVKVAKDAGADCVKFQLFGKEFAKGGNVELNRDLFLELLNEGRKQEIAVTASAFDLQALTILQSVPNIHHIKFGFSRRKEFSQIEGCLAQGRRVVVTTDGLTAPKYPKHENLLLLYTQLDGETVAYPATKKNNFEGMFPERFHGFSDHSYGVEEALEAVKHGAVWVEKHIKLNYSACQEVPDAAFALGPKEFKRFVEVLK